MFANTPESVGEQLPLCDPSGRVWIVKRGHLNNIDELRGRLRDRLGSDARVHTDAEVMLSAYLAWGPDMAGKLNGEFTLAIWDGRRQALFVLRDHLGLRGCYTHDGPDGMSPPPNLLRCCRSLACRTRSTSLLSPTTSRVGPSTESAPSTRAFADRCLRQRSPFTAPMSVTACTGCHRRSVPTRPRIHHRTTRRPCWSVRAGCSVLAA